MTLSQAETTQVRKAAAKLKALGTEVQGPFPEPEESDAPTGRMNGGDVSRLRLDFYKTLRLPASIKAHWIENNRDTYEALGEGLYLELLGKTEQIVQHNGGTGITLPRHEPKGAQTGKADASPADEQVQEFTEALPVPITDAGLAEYARELAEHTRLSAEQVEAKKRADAIFNEAIKYHRARAEAFAAIVESGCEMQPVPVRLTRNFHTKEVTKTRLDTGTVVADYPRTMTAEELAELA